MENDGCCQIKRTQNICDEKIVTSCLSTYNMTTADSRHYVTILLWGAASASSSYLNHILHVIKWRAIVAVTEGMLSFLYNDNNILGRNWCHTSEVTTRIREVSTVLKYRRTHAEYLYVSVGRPQTPLRKRIVNLYARGLFIF